MGRTSTKTPETIISELQSKIAKIQGQQARKTYADIGFIQDLMRNLESIGEDIANAKPFIASDGPRSLSIRIEGAELKSARYRLELDHNRLIQTYMGKIETFQSNLMGEAISRLQKGDNEDKVEAYISMAQKKFSKDNAEDMTIFSASLEKVNNAIQACENHRNTNTPKIEGKISKREFYRKYSNPIG